MLPALYDDQRAGLSRIAGMLVIAGAAILPMTAQSSSIAAAQDQGPHAVLALPAVPQKLTFPSFAVKRDPFRANPSSLIAAGASADEAMQPGDDGSIGVTLPPNAGALGVPGSAVVRAIITGGGGRALIDLGGTVQVFAGGDRIGDQRIVSIDETGVHLSDGTVLPLAGEK